MCHLLAFYTRSRRPEEEYQKEEEEEAVQGLCLLRAQFFVRTSRKPTGNTLLAYRALWLAVQGEAPSQALDGCHRLAPLSLFPPMA